MAEYTGIGQGTYNTVAGSIGLASAVLGNGFLGGIFGGNNQNYVNKETFDLSLNLAASQRDNAILTAELASEKKMVEVFNAANDKINSVRDEMLALYHTVDKKCDDGFAAQAVINCGFNSSINLLQNQVGQLFGMTKLGILNSSLWPAGSGTANTGTT